MNKRNVFLLMKTHILQHWILQNCCVWDGCVWQSVTYYDWSHPLFEDEWSIDFLEKTEEEAACLRFLTFWQLHTAADVKSISLLNVTESVASGKCTYLEHTLSDAWEQIFTPVTALINFNQGLIKL